MKAMMHRLKSWRINHPQDKVIVISQFVVALDAVAVYLEEQEFHYVRYQGTMSSAARENAVKDFMDNDGPTVMLMSLKAGGVGLNLTRANRVILLDLAWSEAIENQAFDRVHRMGQSKDVFVNRYVIRNTVEDRILALQKKKVTNNTSLHSSRAGSRFSESRGSKDFPITPSARAMAASSADFLSRISQTFSARARPTAAINRFLRSLQNLNQYFIYGHPLLSSCLRSITAQYSGHVVDGG
ncbi:hypothetical protein CALCODRAFT_463847 [Calocera cornea HHB12733]|uniref:Helicase C-terminal domain-containing protein n=1 Tax=Calocera cornea HHB12733 TaxID=1353952 RepID=A0A165JDC6_9BASI|nr:hypothetical protein CALCODRAFT_463847 [Calocera cornea HHB12733]